MIGRLAETSLPLERNHGMLVQKSRYRNVALFLSFVGPSIVFFVCVFIVPMIFGVYLTFTDWNGYSSNKALIGLKNYFDVFTDISFWKSMGNTVRYSLVSVVTVNLMAFGLAYMLTSGIKGEKLKCR